MNRSDCRIGTVAIVVVALLLVPRALAGGLGTDRPDIDRIVEDALDDWQTPGLALAVVLGDEVVLAEGYGLRDVAGKKPVTPDTLFAIGSATKAFTTFTMGLLVDDGLLDWDEPVVTYLPDFRLFDGYATAHLTPRDMACHRSGVPRHDLAWYNKSDLTRADLVRRIRHLEPNEDLRARWQYNNLMYLASGWLVGRLSGTTWEDVVRERIFAPLGMTRSNFSVDDMRRDADHALPYVEKNDEIIRVPFRPLSVLGPAGSINSSVTEMARWVAVHLNRGAAGETSLISPGTIKEMHTPQMTIPVMPKEDYVSPSAYGLGWFVDTWRGHYRVHHGGNIDGFSALVTLFPRDGLGIVALANKGGSPLPGLVTATIADRLLGLEPRPWIREAARERDFVDTVITKAEENRDLFRVGGTTPSRSLAEFAGQYAHPGYGAIEIRTAGPNRDALEMVLNGMTLPLEHYHFDVFNVAEVREEIIPENLRVIFLTDARGRLAGVRIPLEPFVEPVRFDRLPPGRLRDPAYLARLVGDYALPNRTLAVSLRGDVLVARVEGGPEIELVPAWDDEFEMKGISTASLRFTVPRTGPATQILLIQPGSVLAARRR